MESTMACSPTTCCKVRQSHRDTCPPKACGAVHAPPSMATRCSGGKNAGAATARRIRDRLDAPLLITLPQIPQARSLYPAPMHDVYDPLSPVQGQQRLRAAGDPLLPLPIPSDLHQELTIASRQGILRRFASSHRRLLFSESRTICRCSSKSNLLNYLGYSPLE